MSDPVETVPNRLARFTQAARAIENERLAEPPTIHAAVHWTPSDGIGRIPCIGLDSGHMPGTRPDRLRWGPV